MSSSVFSTVRYVLRYAPTALWLLTLLTFVRPLRLTRKRFAVAAILLFFAFEKFIVSDWFGGHPFYPELPEGVCFVQNWAFVFSLFLCLFSLCPPWRTRHPYVRAAVVSSLALAVSGWGMWEGYRTPDVRRVDLQFPDLPAAFDGMKLVQLTDIHASAPVRAGHVRAIVNAVNELNPDLVCITGDFIDGKPADHAVDVAPLAELSAPYGVYGCSGNHEYYNDYASWRPVYESNGVRMLDNSHVVLTNGADRLVLAGVTDPCGGDPRYDGSTPPDIHVALDGAPDTFRILMSHRPSNCATNAAEGVRLQLSGHTHGGLAPIVRHVVGRLEANAGHVRGIYQEGPLTLYVSAGTGQWMCFPVRLFNPAEITLFTLRKSRS